MPLSPEHFRALAHALKLCKPRRSGYAFDSALDSTFRLADRQWIEAVKLTADVCAAYGFTRAAFLDACDFDAPDPQAGAFASIMRDGFQPL